MITNLLTRKEAIKYLKIGSTSFRKYERLGVIKPLKATKNASPRKRYNPAQLDRVWI